MQGVLSFIAGLLCGAFVGFTYHAVVVQHQRTIVAKEAVPAAAQRSPPISSARCYNTTCTLYNFCIAKRGGIFPRYAYNGTLPLMAQLATFTDKGKQNFYEGFNAHALGGIASRGMSGVEPIKERPVLLAFAPAAWPNKFPAHTILNNFVPIFSQLQWLEPERLYNNHWQYSVDLVARCCAYAGGHVTHPEHYRWLGRKKKPDTKPRRWPRFRVLCRG